MTLTWDDILRRSKRLDGDYCGACHLFFAMRGVPCLRHTLPVERQARARAIGAIR